MYVCVAVWLSIHPDANTLKPKQNGHHYADNIFSLIFLYVNYCISIHIFAKICSNESN